MNKIPEGWVSENLGDLLARTGGSIKTGPFGTVLKASEYSTDGVPIISVGEVGYGSLHTSDDTPRAPSAVVERLSEYRLQSGDIVFGRKGGVDRAAWVKPTEDGWFLGSDGIRLRVSPDTDSRFMAYQIQGFEVRQWLLQHATGSTMLSLSQKVLERLPVVLPPIAVQRAIAEVLGALDDKIAANHKLVGLLRETAHAEFSLSVRDHSLMVTVGDIAEFHNKRRAPLSAKQREAMIGDVPYYGATGVFDHVDRALFDEILLLVGEDGSVVTDEENPVTQYIWGPAWVNNHAHVLTGRRISTELLTLAIERAQVSALITGAVQPKLSMGNLKRLELEIPTTLAIEQLDAKVQSVFEMVRSLTEESRTLRDTRDALLPRLMSGELRVRDAERVVENVM